MKGLIRPGIRLQVLGYAWHIGTSLQPPAPAPVVWAISSQNLLSTLGLVKYSFTPGSSLFAVRTLILPALHGTPWKIHDEDPQQGDDEEPYGQHQELPDL